MANAVLITLTFHGVGQPRASCEPGEMPYWLSRDRFHAILDRIPRNGSVQITFDDGNASDIELAVPALLARGLRASFFVVAGRIGEAGFLSRSGLDELLRAGMEIGSHGMRHRPWRRMDAAVAHEEIVEARQRIEQCMGRPVTKAACPFGAYDRRSLHALRQAGFNTIFTSDRGPARAGDWLQARNTLTAADTPEAVASLLSSPGSLPRGLARRGVQLIKRSLPLPSPVAAIRRRRSDLATLPAPAAVSTAKVVPIEAADLDIAVDLLMRGPWRRPQRFWETGLQRMVEQGDNRELGVPLGHQLRIDNRPAGILLTLASRRARPDGSLLDVVNFSGWYVEPDQRWRAPLLLRAAMRRRGVVFTDFSPSKSVQAMLPALGLSPLNRGEAVVLLAAAAAGGRGTTAIRPLDGTAATAGGDQLSRYLQLHKSFGCFAVSLDRNGDSSPLLFKRRSIRGIPAAQLVYCENIGAVRAGIAAIARFLVREGCQLLLVDIPLDTDVPGIHRLGHALKFASDPTFAKGIDYIGSELCLFDM